MLREEGIRTHDKHTGGINDNPYRGRNPSDILLCRPRKDEKTTWRKCRCEDPRQEAILGRANGILHGVGLVDESHKGKVDSYAEAAGNEQADKHHSQDAGREAVDLCVDNGKGFEEGVLVIESAQEGQDTCLPEKIEEKIRT